LDPNENGAILTNSNGIEVNLDSKHVQNSMNAYVKLQYIK